MFLLAACFWGQKRSQTERKRHFTKQNRVFYNVLLCCYTIFVCLSPPGALRAAPRGPRGSPRGFRTLLGGPNGASAGPPGVLLERSWCLLKRSRDALDGSWRLLAAPRALPGRFWRSPDALLGPFGAPGPHSRAFFFPECFFLLAFGATATKTATTSWSLALEALDQGSGVLGFSSGIFGFSSGVVGFSSGVLACDSGVLGCIFSSGASALRSWAF